MHTHKHIIFSLCEWGGGLFVEANLLEVGEHARARARVDAGSHAAGNVLGRCGRNLVLSPAEAFQLERPLAVPPARARLRAVTANGYVQPVGPCHNRGGLVCVLLEHHRSADAGGRR